MRRELGQRGCSRRNPVTILTVMTFAAIHPIQIRAQQTLTAVKDLTIDATDNNLSVVREVLASPSGTIAVFQPQDMLIRFFSATGASLGTFGRDGEGPGEFRSMGWAGWNGDTLHVEDSGIRRVTFIGPDRKLLRTVPEPVHILAPRAEPDGAPLLGGAAVVGVMADGTYLLDFFASGSVPAWFPGDAKELSYSLVHVDHEGRFMRVAASLRDKEPWCSWGSPSIAVPLCSHFVTGDPFTPAMASVSIAHGSSHDTRYHLRVIGSIRGDTVIDRDYDYRAVPIPPRVVDSVRRQLVSRPGLSPPRKAAYRSVPFPRYFPPVVRMLVGMDTSVWLEEPATAPGVHRWRIVDSRGRVLGVTSVPGNVTLKDVRLDAAWGTETDADGLQSVVRFRVR